MRSGISAHVWTVALVFAAVAAVSQPAAADDRQECLKTSRETAAAAIAPCTRAIESGEYEGRDLSDLYHHRGYTWSWTSAADRVDRAFEDYTEAIRVDPKAVSSLLNRANIYNERHDYDSAIVDANQAFESGLSDHGKAVGYQARGNAYQAKGDYDHAIADFSESIRLDANNKVTLVNRGNAYLAKGDPDRAIADYDQVIALNPKSAIAYYNRALAYRDKGDVDRVIGDCSQAIALFPRYRDAYLNRGYAYQIKKDFDRAIADYSQTIALDPQDRDPYGRRAVAYLSKGDLGRSIADYSQVLPWTLMLTIFMMCVVVGVWPNLRRSASARGRPGAAVEIGEQELVEMRRRNAALERIAAALAKHSPA
ncbi:tetratricopeptide repeat protein [Bradyrhizobium sp. NAS96.2]|uniref:tetratricopeptide repeat protein n=1 Tax=Bradyrhizobium sp. NAS96.2 TaxID=1680160 RepID=UPI00093F6B75|nr:tetratricopeptide repeat protein [Bradyrhizobium sp. NAS96.2]